MADFFGAGNVIRRLFTDRCTVEVLQPTLRADGATEFTPQAVYTDLPCRISYDTVPHAKQNDKTAHIPGEMILFLPPNADVPPGSTVTVIRDGRQIALKATGAPKRYPTHLQIAAQPAETEA
ncbi:MAG: hypothetical protein IJ766_01230 [Clostridia bacterium]|nr:hypothetical protein [Clostridia bacterium]